jgi:[ribosomal protein S18]-alanine N-acetyltransferase
VPNRGAQLRRATVPHGTVRLLGSKDTEELSAVERLARACFDEESFSAEEEIARPWSRIWSAYVDGDIDPAGFLVAWHVADELHVLNIATRPSQRRRGVARLLMQDALAYAARHHIRILLLEVRRSNRPAIKLYRGLGFTALGVRSAYYADNGEDAVEMLLALDPTNGHILPGRDEISIDG